MFRGIARFSTQGRWQAAIAITLLSFVALVLPPVSYLAGGVIALCTLRMGPKEGISVVLATTVVFTLFAGLLLNQFSVAGLFLLSSWLPVLAISLILGYTRSLATSLLVAVGLGLIVVLGFHLVLADPTLWWNTLISPAFEAATSRDSWQLEPAQTQALLGDISSMMTGFVAASFSLNAILGLFIGRAWQADAVNQGGFGQEFRQLNVGKPAAVLTTVLLLMTLTSFGVKGSLLVDLLIVTLMLFVLQGIAVVHAIVKQRQKHKFWLIAMYILLVVMPLQMMLVLVILGILEQWFNFRKQSL